MMNACDKREQLLGQGKYVQCKEAEEMHFQALIRWKRGSIGPIVG
jgi:hypothetical protein